MPVLGRREMQVCRFLAEARSDKEIAFDMGLSHDTVKTYLRNAKVKLRKRGLIRGSNERVAIARLIWTVDDMN